jgi:hypothetical protein
MHDDSGDESRRTTLKLRSIARDVLAFVVTFLP